MYSFSNRALHVTWRQFPYLDATNYKSLKYLPEIGFRHANLFRMESSSAKTLFDKWVLNLTSLKVLHIEINARVACMLAHAVNQMVTLRELHLAICCNEQVTLESGADRDEDSAAAFFSDVLPYLHPKLMSFEAAELEYTDDVDFYLPALVSIWSLTSVGVSLPEDVTLLNHVINLSITELTL